MHFNPTMQDHGNPSMPPHHLGDVPNIKANNEGKADINARIEGATLGDGGPNDLVGKAFVVHEKVDDYKTQPSGNSGDRISCGVVEVHSAALESPKHRVEHDLRFSEAEGTRDTEVHRAEYRDDDCRHDQRMQRGHAKARTVRNGGRQESQRRTSFRAGRCLRPPRRCDATVRGRAGSTRATRRLQRRVRDLLRRAASPSTLHVREHTCRDGE